MSSKNVRVLRQSGAFAEKLVSRGKDRKPDGDRPVTEIRLLISEICRLCCRFPAPTENESVSPRPARLLVEYSSPKNEPPIPEIPPLNEICWRPFSLILTIRSTSPCSSSVRYLDVLVLIDRVEILRLIKPGHRDLEIIASCRYRLRSAGIRGAERGRG